MKGKTCLVTGANSGIGFQTALGLARAGAKVVCVVRDEARGEAATAQLRSMTGNKDVEVMLCDLSSEKSIRHFSENFHRRHDRLHVLINNAGVVNPKRFVTAEGYEATFALNHLGYFLLTHLLLDLLKASAPARIVNLASEAERMGKIDFDDLMGERKYRAFKAYSQSKLANIMFTYDLAKRLEGTGVTVNAVHPGGVATGFGSQFTGVFGMGMKLFRPLMRTAEKGAETVIYLATSPQVEGITGRYWHDKKQIESIRSSYDEGIRRRLWDISERLTGLAEQHAPARPNGGGQPLNA